MKHQSGKVKLNVKAEFLGDEFRMRVQIWGIIVLTSDEKQGIVVLAHNTTISNLEVSEFFESSCPDYYKKVEDIKKFPVAIRDESGRWVPK